MTSAEVVPIRQAQLERREAALEEWTKEQRKVLKQVYAKDLSDPELDFFENVCVHRGLDPFRGQIVPVKRGGKLSIQVTADGYRALAERKGLYGGMETQFCGADGKWRDEWIAKEPPVAARTIVIRRDWDLPVRYVARYSSYVQFNSAGSVTEIWKKGPDFMLGKCSEVGALKRAFPDDLPGRVLEPQSRMSMEARAAGLDNNGRHALASSVSNGRTDSTRELTPAEEYQFRATVAAARAYADVEAEAEGEIPEDVDPVTGEIVTYEPPDDAERKETERRSLIGELRFKVRELDPAGRAEWDAFLVQTGLKGIAPNEMDMEQLHTAAAYFQGWRPQTPEPAVADPPATPDAGSGDSSHGGAGNPVDDGDPRPSWEQQIAEATAPYEWGDAGAIIEAATGRKVLNLEGIAEEDRAKVLDAFRRYADGDVELRFAQNGEPHLVDTPF